MKPYFCILCQNPSTLRGEIAHVISSPHYALVEGNDTLCAVSHSLQSTKDFLLLH
jgi:hypothetical protein